MSSMRDLLSKMLESDVARSAKARLEHALGSDGLGKPGGSLSDLFSGLASSAQTSFGELQERAGSVLGQTKDAVKEGNPLAIGGLAAIAGAVFGGGGGAIRGAVGGGLLAVLGTVAYQALKGGGATSPAKAEQLPASLREAASPAEEVELERRARLVILAMINAAKADGAIDANERSRILGRLNEAGATTEETAFVEEEMGKPLDLNGFVATVSGTEQAAEVYGASLLAIDVDTDAEREYLRKLASALGLDAAVVEQIHRTLGVPPVPA